MSDPVSIFSIKDPSAAIKKSLVEVLNSKASLDDVRDLVLSKTNKSDTEL